MIKQLAVGMVVAGALAAGSASAQSLWYGGASAGQSRSNYDANQLSGNLASAGVTGSGAVSNSDVGVKVFAGYRLNENFSLEGGYFNLGRPVTTNGTITAPGATRTFSGKGEGQGVNFDAVGTMVLGNGISLLGRAGGAYFQFKNTLNVAGAGIAGYGNETSSKFVGLAGVGAQYDFTKTVAARVEVQRFFKVGNSNTGSSDIDLYSAGIVIKF